MQFEIEHRGLAFGAGGQARDEVGLGRQGAAGAAHGEPFVQQVLEPGLVGVGFCLPYPFVDLQQFGEGRGLITMESA